MALWSLPHQLSYQKSRDSIASKNLKLFQVILESSNVRQYMEHDITTGVTNSKSTLNIAKVQLDQAGSYLCKPPGIQNSKPYNQLLLSY